MGTQHGSTATSEVTGLEDLFGTTAAPSRNEPELDFDDVAEAPPPQEMRKPEPAPPPPPPRVERAPEPVRPMRAPEKAASYIGASVRIEGELSGTEDIAVEGMVKGTVSLPEHKLTVAAKGTVHAEIQARSVTVHGKVVGNITAAEIVQVMPSGSMDGDIRAGRVVLADGAKFRGNIQMGWEPEKDAAAARAKREPAQPPAGQGDAGADPLAFGSMG